MNDTVVVDTSALLAILFGEPDAATYAAAIAEAPRRWVGAFNRLEAEVVVLRRKGPAGLDALLALLQRHRFDTIALTPEQATLASSAYARYGKGLHPAGLNLGDCCAYALSRHSGHPLLFKGDDFPQTDVRSALP